MRQNVHDSWMRLFLAPLLAVDNIYTSTVLSIIVPAHNESSRLPGSLRKICAYFDATKEPYEVIVVDDGSTDDTALSATKIARDWPNLKVTRLSRHLGKGAAVRVGMLAAKGNLRLFTDADLSTPIEETKKLRLMIKGNCQVAIASRAHPQSVIKRKQIKFRELMGRTYNRVLQAIVMQGIQDTQCGFKLFTGEAAEVCFGPLRTNGFGFDVEVLLRARRAGYQIAEVPVLWHHVDNSRVRLFQDSCRMLVELALVKRRIRRN